MEKTVQRLSIENNFILLLVIILIAVMHYSRHFSDGVQPVKSMLKNGITTTITPVGPENMEDNSPLRIPARMLME